MRGLLKKDLYFISQQTRMFFVIGFLFVSFYFTKGIDSAPFVVSYTSMMGAILALSTIGYDDYENSGAFLMTLPITRKEYVLEKYIFGVLCCVLTWCFSTSIYLVLDFQEFTELLMMAAFILITILAVEMVLIPIQLKFGTEKGRLALIGVFVLGMLLVTAAKKVIENNYALEAKTGDLIQKLSALKPSVLLLAAVLLIGVEAYISYQISVKILEKKEY